MIPILCFAREGKIEIFWFGDQILVVDESLLTSFSFSVMSFSSCLSCFFLKDISRDFPELNALQYKHEGSVEFPLHSTSGRRRNQFISINHDGICYRYERLCLSVRVAIKIEIIISFSPEIYIEFKMMEGR